MLGRLAKLRPKKGLEFYSSFARDILQSPLEEAVQFVGKGTVGGIRIV